MIDDSMEIKDFFNSILAKKSGLQLAESTPANTTELCSRPNRA